MERSSGSTSDGSTSHLSISFAFDKNAGFIILCTSICIFFLFGEIRNLTSLTRSIHNNNGFSISSFYLSILCILWIGAQFPQEKFLSYGRILTLHYYFLLMCILFSLLSFIWFFSFIFLQHFLQEISFQILWYNPLIIALRN